MLYTGIDLIELSRFSTAVERWGERFLQRVFTESELMLIGGRSASLAARFAAKEAVAKLLGVGVRGLGSAQQSELALGWREIEILRDPVGRPVVYLHGRAAQRAKELGIGPIAISLSHTHVHAIASAVAMLA